MLKINEDGSYTVTIHTAIENLGDGSAVVRYFKTKSQLDAWQAEEESSPYYEGWGEDCTSTDVFHFDKEGNPTEGFQEE